jgi:hypothetical protein
LIAGVTKTSTGTVSSVSGATITLAKGDTTFTVTVNTSGAMTAITASSGIPLDTGGTQTAPTGQLTSGGDSSIPGGTITGQTVTNTAGVTDGTEFTRVRWYSPTIGISYYLDGESSVKISGGNVDIKLGTPKNEHMKTFYNDVEWDYSDIPVNPSNALTFGLGGFRGTSFYTTDGQYLLGYGIDRDNYAELVYVDRNVTLTGTHPLFTEGGKTYKEQWNVSLKTGWNYVFATKSESGTIVTYNLTTGTPPSGFKWQVIQP